MCPGHLTSIGTRYAPSQDSPFSPLNRVFQLAGQDNDGPALVGHSSREQKQSDPRQRKRRIGFMGLSCSCSYVFECVSAREQLRSLAQAFPVPWRHGDAKTQVRHSVRRIGAAPRVFTKKGWQIFSQVLNECGEANTWPISRTPRSVMHVQYIATEGAFN